MPEVRIRKLEQGQAAAWPEALVSSATFTVLDAWSNLVRTIYGHEVHRLEAIQDDEVVGILALTHVRHPIFGNYLVTSPFGSYGGFAFVAREARDALLDQARVLANDLGAGYVNVRLEAGAQTPPAGWMQHPIYSTYRVDLLPGPDQLMSAYSSDHRNHIRKSLKKGFSVRFSHLDLLDDAYEGLARSMHELGSPYHNKNYLRSMAQSLGEALEFVVVHDSRGELAGAGVFISQGDVIMNLHANILRRFRPDYAGEFLYWSVIERYCRKGFKTLDLGRSLNGSGNETFKLKWRPRKVPLAYWYYLPRGGEIPALNQKSPKFRFAIWMWQILPAFVVRPLGPHLIRGII